MKKRILTSCASLLSALIAVGSLPLSGNAAFTSVNRRTISASVTTGSSSTGGALSLRIPQLLVGQAFYGKDVVIPVEISGTAGALSEVAGAPAPGGPIITIIYQLFDSAGASLGAATSLPIGFQSQPNAPETLVGNAVVPAQNVQVVRNGGKMKYHFEINRSGTITTYDNAGTPFEFEFTPIMSFAVSAGGSIIVIPDTYVLDGKTAVFFPPGSLSSGGTVVVRRVEPNSVPVGPGGLPPVVVYDFELQGMSLQREAELTLSYGSRADGSVIGFTGRPPNLAPYWLNGFNWRLLGPSRWQQSNHTVSVRTPHFSTFGLFVSGPVGAADLRPRQRVITPNGDGINDTIDFPGVTATDEVRIFDLKGRRVRTINGPNPIWNGHDDSGSMSESGLYLYQYTSQGERVSGVILIAK